MEKGSTKVQTARNSSTSSSSSLSSSTPSSSSISSSNPQKLTAAQTLQNLSLSFQKLKEQSQNSQDTKTLLTKLTELEEEINTFIKQINQIDFSEKEILPQTEELLKNVQKLSETLCSEFIESTESTSSTNEPSLQVWISGSEIFYDQEKKPFTVYLLEFSYQEKQWTVKLRFSQFKQLNDELKKKYPSYIFPPMPSKKLFGSLTKETVQQRQVVLQDYMQRILTNNTLRSDELVLGFIDPSGYMSAPSEPINEAKLENPSAPQMLRQESKQLQKKESKEKIPQTTQVESNASLFDQLIESCKKEDFNSIKSLLDKGAELNFIKESPSKISNSPLGIVCLKANSGLVSSLIQRGADVNFKDSCGQTVLHLVCSQQYNKDLIPIIRQLVSAGANIFESDSQNHTCFALAQSHGMETAFQGVDKKGTIPRMQEWVWNSSSKTWTINSDDSLSSSGGLTKSQSSSFRSSSSSIKNPAFVHSYFY